MTEGELFPSDENDFGDSADVDNVSSLDKEAYSAKAMRERYIRLKMENMLKSRELVYKSESNSVLAEIINLTVGAFMSGMEFLPAELVGKSQGEIKRRLFDYYNSANERAKTRLKEYTADGGGSVSVQ